MSTKRTSLGSDQESRARLSRLSELELTHQPPRKMTEREVQEHRDFLLQGATGDVTNVAITHARSDVEAIDEDLPVTDSAQSLVPGTEDAPEPIASSSPAISSSPSAHQEPIVTPIRALSIDAHAGPSSGVYRSPAAGNVAFTKDAREELARNTDGRSRHHNSPDKSVFDGEDNGNTSRKYHDDSPYAQPGHDFIEGLGWVADLIEDISAQPDDVVTEEPGMDSLFHGPQSLQKAQAGIPHASTAEETREITTDEDNLLEMGASYVGDSGPEGLHQSVRGSSATLMAEDTPALHENTTVSSLHEDGPITPPHQITRQEKDASAQDTSMFETDEEAESIPVRKSSGKRSARGSKTGPAKKRKKV